MLSGNCTEALSIQANVTISGSSTKLIKNGIARLPFPLPALLKQYWYIKRGEGQGEGICSILCNVRVYFGRADLFDFNRRGAVHVKFIAVEVHFAGHLKLEFGQRAVLDPKLHRPFGVADRPEPELRLRPFFGQVACIDVALLLQFFGSSREFGGLRSRHFEVPDHPTKEPPGT